MLVTIFLILVWIVLYTLERLIVNKIRSDRGQSAIKGSILIFGLNNLWHRNRNYIPKHSHTDCFLFDFWNNHLGVWLGDKVELFDFWLEKQIRSYDAWKLGKELEKNDGLGR